MKTSTRTLIWALAITGICYAKGISANNKNNTTNTAMNLITQDNGQPNGKKADPEAGTIAFLVDYFEKTAAKLKSTVTGLTEAQLQFKPAADRWSVAQCLEHLVAAETEFLDLVKKSVEAPVTGVDTAERMQFTDEAFIAILTDRSRKSESADNLQFDGKYTDPIIAMADFDAARASVLDYIKHASAENLRNHTVTWPFGKVDGYQSLLLIAAHSARHTLQIEEVMADADFPE